MKLLEETEADDEEVKDKDYVNNEQEMEALQPLNEPTEKQNGDISVEKENRSHIVYA